MTAPRSLRLAASIVGGLFVAATVGAQTITEMPAPTVAGSTILTDDPALPAGGPVTLAQLNAVASPAGGAFAGIALKPSGAAPGVLNTQAFKQALGMDAAGLGNLELISVGGNFAAFNAELHLQAGSTELGFGIGDWVGPMILDFYSGPSLVATHTTSTQTGRLMYYAMSGGTFDRVDVRAASSSGNWVLADFFVQAVTGLFPTFAASPTAGNSPLAVQFTDSSYTSDPGGILTWAWDVDGDGAVDYTSQHPGHTYHRGGVYSVKLDVTDATHGTRSITKNNLIEVDLPRADFTSAPVACASSTVQFSDRTAPFATGWSWDVDNDGTVDYTGIPAPVHAYAANGIYACKLTASNPFGTDSITKEVPVGVHKLTTVFHHQTSIAIGGAVYFDLTATNAIGVSALETNYDAWPGTPVGIVIYTMPGTHIGNVTNATAWTKVGQDDGTAVSAGENRPTRITLQAPVVLQPGSYGVALVSIGDGHCITHGAAASQHYNDTNIALTLGSATNLPFTGSTFYPRVWNGSVIYSLTAGAVDYGPGTPAGLGQAAPTMTTTALPLLGATATLEISQHDAGAAGFILLGFGRGPTPTPLGTLNLSIVFPFGLSAGAMPLGAPQPFDLAIPNDCTMAGLALDLQNVNIVAGAPNLVSMSNGVEWTPR